MWTPSARPSRPTKRIFPAIERSKFVQEAKACTDKPTLIKVGVSLQYLVT